MSQPSSPSSPSASFSLQLKNVVIPACVRGFASDADRFDLTIHNGVVIAIEPALPPVLAPGSSPVQLPAGAMALYATAVDTLKARGHTLRALGLYAEDFQPVLTREERIAYLTNPGLIEARVQPHADALKWAEHLVFVFPIWFYGPPAMLKGWLERVWLPGVAFLPPPKKGSPAVPGLRHVKRLTVITHGGSPWRWLKMIGDPARKLFTRGLRALMAKNCKTTWLQLHNMNNVSRAECDAFVGKVRTVLKAM